MALTLVVPLYILVLTSIIFFPPYLLGLVSMCLVILSLCFLVQMEQRSTLFLCLEFFLSEVSDCFR